MFKNYLENQGLSQNTIDSYLYHVIQIKKVVKINVISMEIIRRYLFTCNKKYSPGTTRIIMASLENYCKYKNIQFDQSLKKQLRIKEKMVFLDVLSKSEIYKIINVQPEKIRFNKQRNSLIIESLYFSGIRVSELANLKQENLRSDYINIIGKGNKHRNVVVPMKLLKKLKQIKSHILFPTLQGKKLSPRAINKIIKKRIVHTKIAKNVSAHTFRRSYCTNLIKSGANIKIISLLMGHSRIETTTRYMHFNKKDIQKEYLKYI